MAPVKSLGDRQATLLRLPSQWQMLSGNFRDGSAPKLNFLFRLFPCVELESHGDSAWNVLFPRP